MIQYQSVYVLSYIIHQHNNLQKEEIYLNEDNHNVHFLWLSKEILWILFLDMYGEHFHQFNSRQMHEITY